MAQCQKGDQNMIRTAGRRAGYTLLELMISTSIGSVLLVSLGTSVYFVSKTARSASEAAVQLDSRDSLADMEREIAWARSAKVDGDRLTLTTLGVDGVIERVDYDWIPGEAELLRTDSLGSSVVIQGLSSFRWTTQTFDQASDSVFVWRPLAPENHYNSSSNSTPISLAFGQYLEQTISIPLLSQTSEYWQLNAAEVQVQNLGARGMIEVRVVLNDSRNLGASDLLGRWVVSEPSSSATLRLIPTFDRAVPSEASVSIQVLPFDSAGDVRVRSRSTTSANAARLGSMLTWQASPIVSPAALQLAGKLEFRRVQRDSLWQDPSASICSVGFELVDAKGERIAASLPVVPSEGGNGEVWSPTELSLGDFGQGDSQWEYSGVLDRDSLGRLRLQGLLSTQGVPNLNQRACLSCRCLPDPNVQTITLSLPMNIQSQGLCRFQATWSREAGDLPRVTLEVWRGMNRAGLGTVLLRDSEVFDLQIRFDPDSSIVAWSVSGAPLQARALNDSNIRGGQQGMAPKELELSCPTGKVTIESLVLEFQEDEE